jgi:hypothetical protein
LVMKEKRKEKNEKKKKKVPERIENRVMARWVKQEAAAIGKHNQLDGALRCRHV